MADSISLTSAPETTIIPRMVPDRTSSPTSSLSVQAAGRYIKAALSSVPFGHSPALGDEDDSQILLKGSLKYLSLGLWWHGYLLLTDKNLVIFKKNGSSLGEMEKIIKLSDIQSVSPSSSQKNPGRFLLTLMSGDTQKLSGKNVAERDLWVTTLRDTINGVPTNDTENQQFDQSPETVHMVAITCGSPANVTGEGDTVVRSHPVFGTTYTFALTEGQTVRVWLSEGHVYTIDPITAVGLGGLLLSSGSGVKVTDMDQSASPSSAEQRGQCPLMFSLQELHDTPPAAHEEGADPHKPSKQLQERRRDVAVETNILSTWLVAQAVLCLLSGIGLNTAALQWLSSVAAGGLIGYLWWGGDVQRSEQPLPETKRRTFTLCVSLDSDVEQDTSKSSDPTSVDIQTHQPSSPPHPPTTDAEQAKLTAMRELYPACSDVTLRRFLRSRNGDLAAARSLLDNYARYWANRDPPSIKGIVPELQWCLVYEHGRALDNTPVVVVDVKNLMIKNTTADRLTELVLCLFNDIFLACPEAECMTAIIDVSGFSVLKNVDTNIYKKVLGLVSDLVPEVLRRAFVLQPSDAVYYVWNIIKLFLNPDTIAKIHFLPKNHNSVVLDHISPANLPRKYGGTSDYDPMNGKNATADDPHWGNFVDKDKENADATASVK